MDLTRLYNTEPNWPHDDIQAKATNYRRCKGIQRSRYMPRPRVGDSEPKGVTSEGTSNRTTTDKAFWHFQTLITRPAPWVFHCPATQIPNINRPGRALYRCQVGTDQNTIPCNMWREPRFQENDLQELAKPGRHWQDRGTQDHQEPTSSGQDKGTETGRPKGIQRTTEGS